MALFTLVKYVLAFFVFYIIFILSGPMMEMMRYENPIWDGMPTWMQAWGDQEYGIWILFIVIGAAVIFIAGIAEANRNRNLEA